MDTKSLKILQSCHDRLIDQTVAINRLISSFDSDMSKDERIALKKQVSNLEKATNNLKQTINELSKES